MKRKAYVSVFGNLYMISLKNYYSHLKDIILQYKILYGGEEFFYIPKEDYIFIHKKLNSLDIEIVNEIPKQMLGIINCIYKINKNFYDCKQELNNSTAKSIQGWIDYLRKYNKYSKILEAQL